MTTAGLIIAGLAGLGILVIGLGYLARPRAMAGTFGLPTLPQTEATAWLRLKGIRDATCGVVAAVLLLTAPAGVIGWAVLAFAIIPVGDAVTILRARGAAGAAWGIHVPTAALMLVGAALLLAG